jgi:hypothetical protein
MCRSYVIIGSYAQSLVIHPTPRVELYSGLNVKCIIVSSCGVIFCDNKINATVFLV